jgi:hypothetical protein
MAERKAGSRGSADRDTKTRREASSMAESALFNNPFTKMFSELNAPWFDAFKSAAAHYIDNS